MSVSNKSSKTTSMMSFWQKYFILSSTFSINDFRKINVCWVKQVLELMLRSSLVEVVLKISILKNFVDIFRNIYPEISFLIKLQVEDQQLYQKKRTLAHNFVVSFICSVKQKYFLIRQQKEMEQPGAANKKRI